MSEIPAEEPGAAEPDYLDFPNVRGVRIIRLHLTNFLSYRSAVLEFDDLTALVGPNASGKSNAVAAIKLLREIPIHGLPAALARRGGFDQLRHRSAGHPYDPALRLDFALPDSAESYYELRLRAVAGKRYEIKQEKGLLRSRQSERSFTNTSGRLEWRDREADGSVLSSAEMEREIRIPPGQSAITGAATFGGYLIAEVLGSMQTVEVNPARVGELQEPSSTREFEPDGSNTASILDSLNSARRAELVDGISAIVPGIERIDVRHLADKLTFAFYQETGAGRREFLAKQMSDGTLRALSILLAMLKNDPPSLLVIEEPEIAIHLGALRTLVDILQEQSRKCQVMITTHSADIVDTLDIDALRVVWSENGASRIARVADHTREPVRRGLITPGELLRSDALDPAVGA